MTTPTVARPAAPLVERGYASTAGAWWSSLDAETVPELRWPLSVGVYDAMRRQDAQIQSVLRAVRLPVMQTAWRINGTGCRPEVNELVSQDLGLPLLGAAIDPAAAPRRRRDRFSWSEHLGLALLELPFGHMFFEQVYRIDVVGRARLRKLGPRLPGSIAAVNVARDGGLVSIEQHQANGLNIRGKVVIPVDRLVAYVHEREGGGWLGHSLLRPAYKHWLIKDRLLRVQAQTIERNGMGVPRYTGAPGEEDLTAGRELATAWRAGETAGAAIPNEAKLDLVGVEGDLPDADKPIRYHDEQIARAVLAHFLNLGTQTGSWALGTTFADFFTMSLNTVAQQVADVATQHIVEDLVDLNWGPDEPAPEVTYDRIGADTTAQALKLLIDAGVIRPDRDLEDYVREEMNLPPKGLTGQPGEPPRSPADEGAA